MKDVFYAYALYYQLFSFAQNPSAHPTKLTRRLNENTRWHVKTQRVTKALHSKAHTRILQRSWIRGRRTSINYLKWGKVLIEAE